MKVKPGATLRVVNSLSLPSLEVYATLRFLSELLQKFQKLFWPRSIKPFLPAGPEMPAFTAQPLNCKRSSPPALSSGWQHAGWFGEFSLLSRPVPCFPGLERSFSALGHPSCLWRVAMASPHSVPTEISPGECSFSCPAPPPVFLKQKT